MHIETVEFADFRNFQTLSFTPAPRLNILTGPNAQGKTNLLEGLGVLLVGRSFRGVRAVELPRWQSPRSVVAGELARGEDTRVLRRVIQRRDDNVWAVTGESCPWARVIPFSWQDMAILHGAPQARRDFLDGFAGKLYPAHLTAYSRYRRILDRRNRLLQEGAATESLRSALEPWTEQLTRVGIELLTRRLAAVVALQREVARLYPALAGRGAVTLHYRSTLGEQPTEQAFREALDGRLAEETRRGLTLVGPHRDDIVIEVDGRDLRSFGSRGQQRLMALTLRLAEAGPVAEAVGSSPVLLLDDALSELDPRAQARVLEHVVEAGQVFLTSADATLPETETAVRWEVEGGRVRGSELLTVTGAA
ncbi:MAG TPA: DNA replication and repair protein RecF [Methylomirabilota bacterium]|nr:DNA replication and repair protein RecF [Methylomirabilota bacterium]